MAKRPVKTVPLVPLRPAKRNTVNALDRMLVPLWPAVPLFEGNHQGKFPQYTTLKAEQVEQPEQGRGINNLGCSALLEKWAKRNRSQ
jgi:hypothetical protein